MPKKITSKLFVVNFLTPQVNFLFPVFYHRTIDGKKNYKTSNYKSFDSRSSWNISMAPL
jgi:hypothetical protein